MTDIKDLFKALEQDEVLRDTLEGIGTEGFSVKQVADAIAAAGIEIEPDQVEELLQAIQQRRAEELSGEDLDFAQLSAIAGGGSGTKCEQADDCDKRFKQSLYWNDNDRCNLAHYCDQYYNENDNFDYTGAASY